MAMSTCSASEGRPNMNCNRLAAPSLTTATSAAGTPRISNTTRAGSSHVSADTISARPSWSRSSMKRRTRSRTNGSRAATRRGLNAVWAMRRVRVCAGGSTLVSVGIERNPPSASARPAAGHGGVIGDERVGCREEVVAPQDLLHVAVAGHHPRAELVRPEHRLAFDEPGEVRVRVRQRGRRERIEVDDGHLVTVAGVGSCRSTIMSACRWTMLHAPRSNRKIIVTRNTCGCGSVCPA